MQVSLGNLRKSNVPTSALNLQVITAIHISCVSECQNSSSQVFSDALYVLVGIVIRSACLI